MTVIFTVIAGFAIYGAIMSVITFWESLPKRPLKDFGRRESSNRVRRTR